MVSTAVLLILLAVLLPLPSLPDDELGEPDFEDDQDAPDPRIVRWWLRR